MDFTPQTLDALDKQVRQHALNAHPFECCGIITKNGIAFPVHNRAADPKRSFVISPDDFRAVTRRAGCAGIFHSHIDQPAYVSHADLDGYSQGGLYIVASCVKGHVVDVAFFLNKGPRRFERFR